MCGLVAIYAYSKSKRVDLAELRKINAYMMHRGPDGGGEWISEGRQVCLAHRRLSIIDLSQGGTQPMASRDHKIVISFNGEIYNHAKIRCELQGKGYTFISNSDTEVLLNLYKEKGIGMLDELRGMFAFALWDQDKQAMLLARDPYGIKPLYFSDDGRTVRAASSVKALLAGGNVSREPDPAGIAGFYLFGSVPEPYSTYRDIRAVPAGSYVWVSKAGVEEPKEYFSITHVYAEAQERIHGLGKSDVVEQIREALLDSVKHHLVADVPVGAFLSAGIDSTAIVAMAAECGYEGLNTATLSFDEYIGGEQDEAPLAEEVARRYHTSHKTIQLGSDDFYSEVPKLLKHMDQPSIDGVNTYFVSKLASELGWKVALSGLGGDELFGGYPSFSGIPRWVNLMSLPSRLPLVSDINSLLANLLTKLPPKAAGFTKYAGTYSGAYLLKRGLFLPEELPLIMGHEMAQEALRVFNPIGYINKSLDQRLESGFAKVSVLESSFYMRNQLLRDTDWAGMAHSLEIRTPLVDSYLLKAVVPLVLSLGPGKGPLAMAPKKTLPPAIMQRRKTGFTVPIHKWLQKDRRFDVWREVKQLNNERCPWARRWSYTVMNHYLSGHGL